jgi:hypothetical protein
MVSPNKVKKKVFFGSCSKPGAGALVRLARPRRGKERHALMARHRVRPSSDSSARGVKLSIAVCSSLHSAGLVVTFCDRLKDLANGGQSNIWPQCQPMAAALRSTIVNREAAVR